MCCYSELLLNAVCFYYVQTDHCSPILLKKRGCPRNVEEIWIHITVFNVILGLIDTKASQPHLNNDGIRYWLGGSIQRRKLSYTVYWNSLFKPLPTAASQPFKRL